MTIKEEIETVLLNTPVYDRARKVNGKPALLKDCDIAQATEQLIQLILDRIIGEDEPETDYTTDPRAIDRNDFRAEQRTLLTKGQTNE